MKTGCYIGDLATQVGMSAKTIRYYESLGLLGAPERTESNYRLYSDADAERLRFILGAKGLGLSLADIKDIVSVWSTGEAPCRHVSARLDEKLLELDRRIDELSAFRDRLKAYKSQVDAAGPEAGTPCAHVAGVAEGRFDPAMPAMLSDRPGKKHP